MLAIRFNKVKATANLEMVINKGIDLVSHQHIFKLISFA